MSRSKITKEIELRLGGQMVDVELDPEHYELAINKALEKYRQRSENAVEESFHYFQIQPFRRNNGSGQTSLAITLLRLLKQSSETKTLLHLIRFPFNFSDATNQYSSSNN